MFECHPVTDYIYLSTAVMHTTQHNMPFVFRGLLRRALPKVCASVELKTAKAKRDDALSHQNIQHATSKVYGAIVDVQNVDMASKISQSVRHACRSSRFCRTHG